MRKTTQQKINEGDARKVGKHVLQAKLDAEPRAEHGLPPAPDHLNVQAREAYEFWREQLELMQLDNKPDAQALVAAATHYARAVEADIVIAREGIVLDEPVIYQGKRLRGVTRKRKNPAVTVSNGAWVVYQADCGEEPERLQFMLRILSPGMKKDIVTEDSLGFAIPCHEHDRGCLHYIFYSRIIKQGQEIFLGFFSIAHGNGDMVSE